LSILPDAAFFDQKSFFRNCLLLHRFLNNQQAAQGNCYYKFRDNTARELLLKFYLKLKCHCAPGLVCICVRQFSFVHKFNTFRFVFVLTEK
jgi:hypothetical protein